ncbi:MAG: c-type cytochrome [Candidatus Baltobacteraceae bacterium]
MSKFARGVAAALALATLVIGCAHRSRPGAVQTTAASVSSYDGGAIYRQQCATCHGVRGEGVAGVAPGLRLGAALDAPSALVAVARGVRHGDAVMPGWCGLLSDREIADVMAYIGVTWAGRARASSPSDVATICRSRANRAAR